MHYADTAVGCTMGSQLMTDTSMHATDIEHALNVAQSRAHERTLDVSDVHLAYMAIERAVRAVVNCAGIDAMKATVDLDGGAVSKSYRFRAETTVCQWGYGLSFRVRRMPARRVAGCSPAMGKRLRILYPLPNTWIASMAPGFGWHWTEVKAKKQGALMVFTVYL